MFKDLTDLFASPLRLKTIVFFVRRPHERGMIGDVASTLGAPRDAVQKEIAALRRLGFLRMKKIGNVPSYAADQRHPLFAPIARFAADALTPSKQKIADLFRPIQGVMLVVATGLLQEEPKSPIDLLIVSKKSNERQIARTVKKVEACAAVPIRYAVLDATEYRERRQAYDRLLRDVFEYKHSIVLERGSL